MKLNIMTHYAIKAIKSIAFNEGIVTSTYIATNEGISQGVLMKILRRLRGHNLIRSHQGRGDIAGGYSLRVPANKVTLLDIIEIMEGPLDELFCSQPRDQFVNQKGEVLYGESEYTCLEEEYRRISDILMIEMNRFTIAELFHMEATEK